MLTLRVIGGGAKLSVAEPDGNERDADVDAMSSDRHSTRRFYHSWLEFDVFYKQTFCKRKLAKLQDLQKAIPKSIIVSYQEPPFVDDIFGHLDSQVHDIPPYQICLDPPLKVLYS